jgi:ribonuclease P protein component
LLKSLGYVNNKWIKCGEQIFIRNVIIQILCRLHINPKREKEPSHTVFWCAVNPKPVATPYCEDAAKAEANCQQFKKMLAKKRRIGKKFFSVHFSNTQRFVSPHLLLTVVKNERAQSCFAFSVSKKICKRAVDRNRLRRQGYSVIGKYLKDIPDGFLFFFSFKKGAYPVSFSNLKKEICSLLSVKN